MTRQQMLIDALKRSLQEQGLEVTTRETHVSWILLAGRDAWKIKKEVDFGFLDYSTLEKRKHACEEELRLNQRYAAEIYLDIARICGPAEHAHFNGDSEAIEYAVHMRRFDESGLLSELAKNQQLKHQHIDTIAATVAKSHQQAPIPSSHPQWGEPEQVHQWLTESLLHIRKLVEAKDLSQVLHIEARANQLYRDLHTTLSARNRDGCVRECHGDLHLRNMVWTGHTLLPFDCIEFNPGLRWIDVMSESAFVMMDLQERGYPAYAWRFINQYLSITGDYAGLAVLAYYASYRALVRAKVMLLQRSESETLEEQKAGLYTQYAAYAGLAAWWLQADRPVLIITHGLSASGKSTAARYIAERHGCIHLRSDVERKRLHGLSALEDSHSQPDSGIYIPSASNSTYQRLYELARSILQAGYPLVVDATFLKQKRRGEFQQLAEDLHCSFLIIHCYASPKTLEKRIRARAKQKDDPSEATLEVLNQQIAQQDPLTEHEPQLLLKDCSRPILPRAIQKLLGPGNPV